MSNRRLQDDEMLRTFKSRLHAFNDDPTDALLEALMLDIAERSWPQGDGTPGLPP